MSWLRNLRLMPKMMGSFVLVAILTAIVGAAGLQGVSTLGDRVHDITGDSLPSITAIIRTQRDLNESMLDTDMSIGAATSALARQYAAAAATARDDMRSDIDSYVNLISPTSPDAADGRQVQTILGQWASLDEQAAGLAATGQIPAAEKLIISQEQPRAARASGLLNTIEPTLEKEVASRTSSANSTRTTSSEEIFALLLAAVLLAIGFGWLLARSITHPLAEVERAVKSLGRVCVSNLANGMQAFAQGNLTLAATTGTVPPSYVSLDGIGRTAEAVRDVISKMQRTIADYETARINLGTLISDVAQSADQVHAGSNQLAQTTQQVGEASGQIARSIEEVARGTGEQSRDSADAITQMTALSAAVQQVADGAEGQRQAMEYAQSAVGQLSEALSDTAQSVGAVTSAAGRAAGTAREGGAAVAQTISSIDSVRAAVGQSAEQVAALGQRSQEIGQIVAAIDDIASQTNLLALNAAIEAARAGEHGRGFTVVAAEVRKLAERSSSETKEITQRVAAIQRQVAEVVQAMAVGSSEVERSAMLGRQAEQALGSILEVVEETNAQAATITSAVSRMTASAEAVNAAADHVARVAADTARAAEEMRLGAQRVQASVENIAAVSEETAAGAEEVSASTEEQTAGVEEMSAGAQELAALATGLKELVQRFTLEVA